MVFCLMLCLLYFNLVFLDSDKELVAIGKIEYSVGRLEQHAKTQYLMYCSSFEDLWDMG